MRLLKVMSAQASSLFPKLYFLSAEWNITTHSPPKVVLRADTDMDPFDGELCLILSKIDKTAKPSRAGKSRVSADGNKAGGKERAQGEASV